MSSRAEAMKIEPGQKVERKLAEGETHPYLIEVKAGDYFRILAEQKGVDLELQLFAPGGTEPLVKIDSPTGARGFERVSEIAAVAGEYRVEVVGEPPGDYELHYAEHRAAEKVTEADRKRVAGERVFQEGEGLRRDDKPAEAISKYEQALGLWREAGERAGEANALYRIGWMQELLDRWEEAERFCLRAAEIFKEIEDSTGRAVTLNRRGRVLAMLGRYDEALAAHEESAWLYRETGNSLGQISALNNLGIVHTWAGRLQKAIDVYNQILALQAGRSGNPGEEIAILLNNGELYLLHGKRPEARDQFERALRLAEEVGDRERLGFALISLGELDHQEGRLSEARQNLERAIGILREIGHRRGEAIALNALGTTVLKSGEPDTALARWQEALVIFQELQDVQGEAIGLSNLGRGEHARGNFSKALELHRSAQSLFGKQGNRAGIALTKFGSAQALVQMEDLEGARRELEESLSSVETVRAASESLDLRASYFASKQHYWDLYIDVLMTLDGRSSGDTYKIAALDAAERRRSRSLLEALRETKADIRKGVDPALEQEEQEIRQRLERADRLRLSMGEASGDPKIAELEAEIRDLLARLDRITTQRRSSSPRFADLVDPEPLSLDRIRDVVLDPNTLLLAYSLGEDRSFLWKIARDRFEAHPLPARKQIEAEAQLLHDLWSRPAGRKSSGLRDRTAARLSSLLLGPVKKDIPHFGRLLIVTEGALQLIPFAALPNPAVGDSLVPLVRSHETVMIPSISVMATLRQERPSKLPLRESGPRIAVAADPVFSQDDPRVRAAGGVSAPFLPSRGDLARSVRSLGLPGLARLPYSRKEAEEILKYFRPDERVAALDFDASREAVLSPSFRSSRILHFATHSLINPRQPELSGLVLSQVGPDGTPRDGFLRLHEIYNLQLSADLVVLSACETGTGPELRGEGSAGLTRGFMYAGVPQIVLSLWKVSDRSTAELMTRFYDFLLEKGLPPSKALQKAQLSMLDDPAWSAPYHWAGFVFQGDFTRKPGGGIETEDTGGTGLVKQAGSDLPPPRVAPPRPKPVPAKPPRGSGKGAGVVRSPTPATIGEEIELSCYAPPTVAPGLWSTLLAYCAAGGCASDVQQDAEHRMGQGQIVSPAFKVSVELSIPRGSEILVVPELPGCRFNPPQARLHWLEDWNCAEFRFQPQLIWPESAMERELPGRVSFFVESILAADVPLSVRLSLKKPKGAEREPLRRTEARPYQSVFISYSRSDARVVGVLEQAYAALGFQALRDVRFLRPGEKWAPALLKRIEEADIFQLFWSRQASTSRWVEKEWRHALGLNRPYFIRPVYWEHPLPAPPQELADLHFHWLELIG